MNNTLKLAVFLALNFAAIAGTPKVPTFFARTDYLTFNQFIQVADTNGDGIPDLISITYGTILVQFGSSTGSFRLGPSSPTLAGGGKGFVAVDLSDDGTIDLVMGNGSAVVVSMGNGDGTFQSGVNYQISDSNIGFVVTGDFNGDGILDIAAGGNDGVWLLTGQGGGAFNSAVLVVSLSGCAQIAAADFNQDGNLDLAVARLQGNNGAGFAVILGNGNGTFRTPLTFSKPNRPDSLAVGSLTKDGPPSIALNDSNTGYAYLYFGNGEGGFTGPKLISLPDNTPNSLALGDVNGDGRPDLVSTSGYVAYGEGGGHFTAPIGFPVSSVGPTSNIVLSDLRNNGLTDIVTSGGDLISVLLNQGNKGFEDGIWTSVTGGAGCGVKADFNGDGRPDLAVSTPSGISILLGTGKAASPFTDGTDIAVAGAACVVTGDLNGDGIPDLLVPVNGSVNGVNAYLGNGDGSFTLTSTTPTPGEGGWLAVGDFNQDGKLDFVTSGNLIALGNGDGTFQSPTDIVADPPEYGFSGIAVGDVNNDGWPDLVLTSDVFPVNAPATVLLNDHEGGFTQVSQTIGALTVQPILADLNGDGNLDLVLLETDSGEAGLYLGDGKGGFTHSQYLLGPISLLAGHIFVADVNGDGILDVGVSASDTLEIYLGEGNATYTTPFAIGTGPSPGSILVEHLHGQPAASPPDIVVPDTSGGVEVLLNLIP
jgi:FG-GAP-like repeat/FG-GAP repeat